MKEENRFSKLRFEKKNLSQLPADNESGVRLSLPSPQWIAVTTSSLLKIAGYDRAVQEFGACLFM
jgi:hypothetical protein